MDATYSEARFSELVLFLAGSLRADRSGGGSKLARVLYFADFAHVRRHRRPITGAEYARTSSGPCPRPLAVVRERLVFGGDARVVVEDFLGYEVRRLVPTRDAEMSVFAPEELVTIAGVLRDLANLTEKQVDDLSQGEPGWRLAQDGEAIPYETALIAPRQVLTPTALRLAGDVAARYGLSVDA